MYNIDKSPQKDEGVEYTEPMRGTVQSKRKKGKRHVQARNCHVYSEAGWGRGLSSSKPGTSYFEFLDFLEVSPLSAVQFCFRSTSDHFLCPLHRPWAVPDSSILCWDDHNIKKKKNPHCFLLFWLGKKCKQEKNEYGKRKMRFIGSACNHRYLIMADLCLAKLDNVFTKTAQS